MGYSATQEDCDDNLSDVYPDAPEYCNGDDEDCDGETFDAESLDAIVQYEDADGDGFGTPDVSTISCSSESGYVEDDTDCDDSNIDISLMRMKSAINSVTTVMISLMMMP